MRVLRDQGMTPEQTFRLMANEQLAYVVRQLQQRLAALRSATSAIAEALRRDHRERLDQARAEQERRQCAQRQPATL